MPKILITGNGFDLSLGLPTAYNDFIRVMSYVKSANIDEINFQSVFSNLENHEKFFAQFNAFEIDKTEIKKIKPILEENLWFKYFEDKLNFQTWIDFEQEIEHILLKLFNFLNLITTENISSINRNHERVVLVPLSQSYPEEFQVAILFNLISETNSHVYSFTKTYCNYVSQKFSGWNKSKIIEHFTSHFFEFNQIFNFYFNYFLNPLIECIDSTKVKYDFSLIDYHFTFNYTNTFEKLMNNPNVSKHLHGKTNSDAKPLVLGFSEIPEQITEKEFVLPFVKYFQKLHFQTEFSFLKSLPKNYKYYEFIIFGHSLSKSDMSYIHELFDLPKQYKGHIRDAYVYIIYKDQASRFSILRNLILIRGNREIEELILEGKLKFIESDTQELNSLLSIPIDETIIRVNTID